MKEGRAAGNAYEETVFVYFYGRSWYMKTITKYLILSSGDRDVSSGPRVRKKDANHDNEILCFA
jgi:hypothetical protein